jgi:hypothetical protein
MMIVQTLTYTLFVKRRYCPHKHARRFLVHFQQSPTSNWEIQPQVGTTSGGRSPIAFGWPGCTLNCLLGLLANSVLLYDPQGVIQELVSLLYPYPAQLKENLLRHFWPILQAELGDLRDCAERGIGNSSFLFHLWRASDALISLLFAINEHYDPATKRPEQALAKLPWLPGNFSARYEQLFEGPFTPAGRGSTVNALTALTAELAPWLPGENEEKI